MKNINNKISIVTPTLNSETYLEATIMSIIGQAGDFQIDFIIADGGSTDKTLDIAHRYQKMAAEKKIPIFCAGINIRVISEKDSGMYQALNRGFQRAEGDIMTWLNSDDLLLPNSLKTIVLLFHRFDDIEWLTGRPSYANCDGFIYGVFNIIGYDQRRIQRGMYRHDCLHFIQQEGTFWTKKLWLESGGRLDENLRYAGDYELWLRFAKYQKLYTVHSSLAAFRSHSNQLTATSFIKYVEEMDGLRKIRSKTAAKAYFYFYKRLIYHFGNRINFGLPYIKFNNAQNAWIRKN